MIAVPATDISSTRDRIANPGDAVRQRRRRRGDRWRREKKDGNNGSNVRPHQVSLARRSTLRYPPWRGSLHPLVAFEDEADGRRYAERRIGPRRDFSAATRSGLADVG